MAVTLKMVTTLAGLSDKQLRDTIRAVRAVKGIGGKGRGKAKASTKRVSRRKA